MQVVIDRLHIVVLFKLVSHDESISKAKAAYQDFLALWKDADSDAPILKQAKAEFVKLQ